MTDIEALQNQFHDELHQTNLKILDVSTNLATLSNRLDDISDSNYTLNNNLNSIAGGINEVNITVSGLRNRLDEAVDQTAQEVTISGNRSGSAQEVDPEIAELHQEIHDVAVYADDINSEFTDRVRNLENDTYLLQLNTRALHLEDEAIWEEMRDMDIEHHEELHRLAMAIDDHESRIRNIELNYYWFTNMITTNSENISDLSDRLSMLERKVAYYHPDEVSIEVIPTQIAKGQSATMTINVTTVQEAQTVEVYRIDHGYKFIGRSSVAGTSFSFTDTDTPTDTVSLVYRVEAAIGSELKTAEAIVKVDDNDTPAVSISVSPTNVYKMEQATLTISVNTTQNAQMVDVYRIDHGYKFIGRSTVEGTSFTFTDTDTPTDTASLIYRVEAVIGDYIATNQTAVTVTDNYIDHVNWTGYSLEKYNLDLGETVAFNTGTVEVVYTSGHTVDVTNDPSTSIMPNGGTVNKNAQTYTAPTTQGYYYINAVYNGVISDNRINVSVEEYVPAGVTISVSPQSIQQGVQSTVNITVNTTKNAQTVEVYRTDHGYKFIGRSSVEGTTFTFTDTDTPADTVSLVYRVEASMGSELKTDVATVTVVPSYLNVFCGSGANYQSVTFTDLGESLKTNMHIEQSVIKGDYIFIKCDKKQNIISATTDNENPFWNTPIDLESPVVDGNYHYYRTSSKYAMTIDARILITEIQNN